MSEQTTGQHGHLIDFGGAAGVRVTGPTIPHLPRSKDSSKCRAAVSAVAKTRRHARHTFVTVRTWHKRRT